MPTLLLRGPTQASLLRRCRADAIVHVDIIVLAPMLYASVTLRDVERTFTLRICRIHTSLLYFRISNAYIRYSRIANPNERVFACQIPMKICINGGNRPHPRCYASLVEEFDKQIPYRDISSEGFKMSATVGRAPVCTEPFRSTSSLAPPVRMADTTAAFPLLPRSSSGLRRLILRRPTSTSSTISFVLP